MRALEYLKFTKNLPKEAFLRFEKLSSKAEQIEKLSLKIEDADKKSAQALQERLDKLHQEFADILTSVLKDLQNLRDLTESKNKEVEESVNSRLNQSINDLTEKVSKLVISVESTLSERITGLSRDVEDKISKIQLIKGDKGDSIKGDKGDTPIPGVDYPTQEQLNQTISEEVKKLPPPDFSEKLKSLLEEFKLSISADASFIARALETLKGKERLDYEALKNKPGIKVYEEKESKIYARGGGSSDVRYYDLSSELNGVLKTFTIPANKRVVGVFSTQFPINLRPLIDWTFTQTTLTLTSEVAAPETGQTLYILYIPL